MKTIDTRSEVLDLIRTKQPITFEQLLEDADLHIYHLLLRPGIMANILTELLAAQAIQLTASTRLPLSFIIAEGQIGEEARNEDHRPH
jgi:hypothetical protein